MLLLVLLLFFFFKQKTAYEMRISDWSSDVCSSDLRPALADLGLDRGETPGFGQGFERGERYTVLAAPQQPNLVVPGNIGLEEQQFLSTLFSDGACKCQRIRRQVQSCVFCLSPRIHVLGKIVIGIEVSRSEERRVGKEWVSP